MSEAIPLGEKPRRRRDKLLNFLKSSSSTSTDSTKTIQTPNLQPSNISKSSSVEATDQTPLPLHPAQPSTIHPALSAPGPLTVPSSSRYILQNAWQKLPDHHRKILEPYVPSDRADVVQAVQRSLDAAKQKQQRCEEKRWKFTFAGRTIVLKEVADKVVLWLDRFKAVGDLAAQIDPVHLSLPWAGFRFVLEAAVSETKQMASLLIGCETALYVINRLEAYMDFLVTIPASLSRTNFETGLVNQYALVLSFLAQAIEAYQRPTVQRAWAFVWQDSDVQDFQSNCDRIANRVEIEASNCDRTLSGHDRTTLQQLQETLKRIEQSHVLEASLKQLETKIDLDNLRFVKEAAFNAYEQVHRECHPDTRVDLLRDIQDWAGHSQSRNMFWLQGMAGTGKSTISYTFAKQLYEQDLSGKVDLGASFFFKRGEGDRGSAALLFPTIAHQLARKVPSLGVSVAEAIGANPDICSKALGEQFEILISQPIKKCPFDASDTMYIVIIDALDECKVEDIDVVLQLWSKLLTHHPSVRLRLFLTSRPDLPIRLRFSKMSPDAYQELVLHNVPRSQIQQDILTFLKDRFATIRQSYDRTYFEDAYPGREWPGEEVLNELTSMAVPLFIVAATISLFIDDPDQDPVERLEAILHSRQRVGQTSKMAQTYLPVLQQLHSPTRSRHDEEELYAQFRAIIGSIITLVEPLSQSALADLLCVSPRILSLRLRPFYSVLQVPHVTSEAPVRPLHLSFSEFLTGEEVQGQPFSINSPATHDMLVNKCLELLSRTGSNGLCENMCSLTYPGQPRQDIDPKEIRKRFPPAIEYACRHWTHHVQNSGNQIVDNGVVHQFLQKHFLHWLEALSLLDCIADAIMHVTVLRRLVSLHDSANVTAFLTDAPWFVRSLRYAVNIAPLQLYSSATIFAPHGSVVRKVCGRTPDWILRAPNVALETWGSELQHLEGHTGVATAAAFSPDGNQLASVSWDGTLRLWDVETGQEMQKLKGHIGDLSAVAFSLEGSYLVSRSRNGSVQLWDSRTGQEIWTLEGHTGQIIAISFVPNGSYLLTASWDRTLRLWDVETGQEVQKLGKYTGRAESVVFSPNCNMIVSIFRDDTLRLWDIKTGQEVQKLEGHTGLIEAVIFSPDGNNIASAAFDQTVRLWDVKTGREIQRLEGQPKGVTALAFSPDGSQLASSSYDQMIRLYDLKTGRVRILQGQGTIMDLVFSPDGTQLASASGNWAIQIWDTYMKPEARELERLTAQLGPLAFSPDGSQLASISIDKTMQAVQLWDTKAEKVIQHLKIPTDFDIHQVVFSPDGDQLALRLYYQVVLVWDTKKGHTLRKFEGHTGKVTSVALSSDGESMASASYDGTVRLWNIETGQEFGLLDHNDWVSAVTFSSDGRQVASGTSWGSIMLWEAETGQKRLELKIQDVPKASRKVVELMFSPDGGCLVSRSNDRTVRLWDANTGHQLQTWKNCGRLPKIDFLLCPRPISADPRIVSNETSLSAPSSVKVTISKGFWVDDKWIKYEDKNLLWLPPAYRGRLCAHNDLIALGRQDGTIAFIKLRHL